MAGTTRPQQAGVGTRPAKDALFDGLASVAKALANGHRAEILELLAQGERSVEQVAEAIEQSVANTSHHLRVLASAGLVATRRDSQRVCYRLASQRVAELWAAMRDVAASQVAGLDRLARAYLGDRQGLEAVGRDELAQRIQDGAAVVLDVRPRLEYEAGHIAGAGSAPVDELDQVLQTLPDDAEVIAYCRGPYCVFADEAVSRLREAGYEAWRLEEGYPEWEREGRPITRG
jgi:rhodanese-related sulfurtransferase/DNA-binding MarR family transcriptional regulator